MVSNLTREQRIVVSFSLLLGCVVFAVWLILGSAGRTIAESIVSGAGPFAYLKGNALRLLVGVPVEQQAEALLVQLVTFLGRLTTIYVFCQCLLLVGSLSRPRLFADFFSATSHPINLAVFRIVFFVTLLPRVSLKKTLHLVSLPEESRVSPPGLGWLVTNLPESPNVNTTIYWCFFVACVLGTVGLWTRLATVTATLTTFYLLGITQFFGKIEHQHHLIWIGALLAVSRCADVLSLDAFIKKEGGPWLARAPGLEYALPLRFVWLFLGVIYFFPGMWKYVISGPDWFLSENLQSRMLLRLFVSEGWSPIVRMDQYPFLCTLGGLSTILMEIGFVFLVFMPKGRYVAAAGGLWFHWMVQLFLNISFWPIQAFYVSFFDWHRIGVVVRRRAAAAGLLSQNSLNREASSQATVADESTGKRRWIYGVGAAVLIGNIMCGFTMLDSWPFGVYPTFARVIGPTFESLAFVPMDAQGRELEEIEAFFDPTVRKNFGVGIGRLGEILGVAMRPHADRSERLLAVWEQWQEQHPEMENVVKVDFYQVQYSTDPAVPRKPTRQKLLASIPVAR